MKQTIKLVMLAIMLVLTLSVLAQAQSITVALPIKQDPPGGPSTIPITVGDTTGRSVFAYDFEITFDPAVLQPQATPFDATGTLSSGWSITPNATTPGHLILNAFNTGAMAGQGVLLNLKFNVVGAAGTQTPLTWASFNFNEGDPADTDINGQFTAGSPTAASGVVTGSIVDKNGMPVEGAVVRLNGTQNRKFITDANGFYRFDNVETSGFYTVTPSRANYTFNPSVRSFSQIGETTEATFGATFTGENANPLDTPEYFVRQHYLDFLNREPDESGFNFWSDQILECGNDQNCIERRRENVSAAYFLSIEFQQTGGLVDVLYRASYRVSPQYAEFMPDTRAVARDVVVGHDGWQAKLEANKQAFVAGWLERPAFRAAYDGLTNSQYVDALITHTGVSFTESERESLLSSLTNGNATRADVLRSIAEDERFVNAKRSEMFVMMEYFGYLRRDPDASGFQFWLNKLNLFGGNFVDAEMVKAFIVAGEYRQRFGP